MSLSIEAIIAVDNSLVADMVSKAQKVVQQLPVPSESALRSVEGLLRGKLVCIGHELMYLLQARELYLREYEKVLARL